jgi:hypothetical protein
MGPTTPGQRPGVADVHRSAARLLRTIDRALVELLEPKPLASRLAARLGSDDLRVLALPPVPGAPPLEVAYLETSVDPKRLVEEVLAPLRQDGTPWPARLPSGRWASDPRQILEGLAEGQVAVAPREGGPALLVDAEKKASRPVEQPSTETVLIGPKLAFTEDLMMSLGILRRLLPTDRLRVRTVRVGTLARRKVAVVYLAGIAGMRNVRAVIDALAGVQVDVVRSPEDLAQLILGRREQWTFFPLAQQTERPDIVTEGLAVGRVAVLMEGAPFALLLPATLVNLQQMGETMMGPPAVAFFIRWLRFLGTATSVITPAVYALIMGVNPRLLPPDTLLQFSASREGIPYSALLETLVMMVMLDVVIEASQQAPSKIGQTLTIVGGIIIGQVAVQARLVSQLMVIVLAVTAIGSLLSANLSLGYALRIVKYPLTILGGVLGVFGLMFGVMALIAHLASLRSLGTPYLAPFAPMGARALRLYAALSAPRFARRTRPGTYGAQPGRRGQPSPGGHP